MENKDKGIVKSSKPLKTKKVGVFKKREEKIRIEGIMMYLMRNDGRAERLENVSAGEFILDTPEGKKMIMLRPEKLFDIKDGEDNVKVWFCHEDCFTPLPEEPIHSSLEIKRKIDMVMTNIKERNEGMVNKEKMKLIGWVIFALVIGAILFLSTPWGKDLMDPIASNPEVVKTVAENVSNIGKSLGG